MLVVVVQMLNSTGTRAEPCGTPVSICHGGMKFFGIREWRPAAFIFDNKYSWRILSNLFTKSRDTVTVV